MADQAIDACQEALRNRIDWDREDLDNNTKDLIGLQNEEEAKMKELGCTPNTAAFSQLIGVILLGITQ